MRLPARLGACATLLSLVALPAAAQVADSTRGDSGVVQLAPIEVVGSILPAPGPRVGSGVPGRSTVIDFAEIDAFEPRLLTDVLGTQAGVSLYDDLGSPYKLTLGTRGFTASPVVGLPQGISVFLDGVPVNEPDAAQVNFDLLPLEHVRRVEFLSGTASLLGPNSLGGAVNLVTNPGGGPTQSELELSGGSYDQYAGEASLSGSAKGWSYYGGGGYTNESGWRQATGSELYNGFLNFGRSGERSGIRLQALAAQSRVETAGSLPESIYDVAPATNFTIGDFEDLSQRHLALSGYSPVGAGRGSFTAYYRRHTAERFNVNQVTDPDVRSFSRNWSLGANADWRLARPVGEGVLTFRAGASGAVNDARIQIFAERIDPGQTTDVDSPIRELGAYTLADFSIGRISISGGVRGDFVRIPFRNLLDPARDTTSSYTRLSPRGGVSVDLGQGASVYGSLGQSFRAPALIELACADPLEPCPLPFALGDDPPLDPVTATTIEFGTKLVTGPAILSASVYRTRVRNDIVLFPYDDTSGAPQGSSIDGFFANIDATRREGVEVSGQLLFGQGHSIYANYAYTLATFQTEGLELFSIREEAGGDNEIEKGDRFPLVPDHQLRAGGTVMLPAGFSAGADLRYTGRQYLRGDEANEEEPLDGYATADLRLSFETGPWEITGIVSNLANKHYATFGTFNLNQAAGGQLERFLTPGQVRQVRLVVRRSFGGD
jgi:iron complex outermembrane recepter protein